MADAERAMREMEPWPGYDEQSWRQRFATFQARHQTLLEQIGKALSRQIERACKAESVNADLLEALKANLGTLEEQRRRCQRWDQSHHELDCAIDETETAISKAEKSNG